MEEQRTYSTGEVAKLCEMANRTVCKWFDKGLLLGFRTPGPCGHRRIFASSLNAFMDKHGFPTRMKDSAGILAVGLINPTKSKFGALVSDGGFVIDHANDAIDAAMLSGMNIYRTVVVDLSVGRHESMLLALHLLHWHARIRLVAIAGEDGLPSREELVEVGYHAVFYKPIDVDALFAAAIERQPDEPKS